MAPPLVRAPERNVSPVLLGMVLRYVERSAGATAVDSMVELLGGTVASEELRDPNRWMRADDALDLVDAAGSVCRESQLGRRVGEELFRSNVEEGLRDYLVASGSIAAAYSVLVEAGSKLGAGRMFSLVHVADDHVIVEGEFTGVHFQELIADNAHRARFFCDIASGYFAQVASLFGCFGTVVERRCQLLGAPTCEYRVAWRPDPSAAVPDDEDAAASAVRSDGLLDRFEELQAMASAILGADDVKGALERIMSEVRRALQAPQYLLAMPAGDSVRVHQFGFDPTEALAFARALLADELSEADGVVSVDVVAGGRHFGRLAAVFAAGVVVTPVERRTLSAYAGHAAAVLNMVAALEAARLDRDTAEALLSLARELAEVSTTAEIAAHICAAVPHVTVCDVASVYLLDAAAGVMRLAASTQRAGTPPNPTEDVVAVTELGTYDGAVANPCPATIDVATARPDVQRSMRAFRLERAAIVPIHARGRLIGAVIAGVSTVEGGDLDDALFARLAGLADHAATAIENAELLGRMRHESLHDRLTGLPNRTLVEVRGHEAFARVHSGDDRVGLLFIDLDRFKNVNDTLGHRAGDDLIRAVADRLAGAVREGDTLARLGGDEFVMLLAAVDSVATAAGVAERVIDALRTPFEVLGQELFISCSVGVACSPEHGDGYDSLLQYADSAMYTAKGHG
nr:diguanylate cyclase [Actinomycetota bacterium]